MLGKLDEAHEFCSRAILTNPLYAEAHNNLGVLYRDEGRIVEALGSYEACLRIDPLSRNAGQNRLLAMNSLSRPEQSEDERAEMVRARGIFSDVYLCIVPSRTMAAGSPPVSLLRGS
jgi:protein O-GlcNAc transferase